MNILNLLGIGPTNQKNAGAGQEASPSPQSQSLFLPMLLQFFSGNATKSETLPFSPTPTNDTALPASEGSQHAKTIPIRSGESDGSATTGLAFLTNGIGRIGSVFTTLQNLKISDGSNSVLLGSGAMGGFDSNGISVTQVLKENGANTASTPMIEDAFVSAPKGLVPDSPLSVARGSADVVPSAAGDSSSGPETAANFLPMGMSPTSLNGTLPLTGFQLIREVDSPAASASIESPSPAGGNVQTAPPALPLDPPKNPAPAPLTNIAMPEDLELIGMRQSTIRPADPNVNVPRSESLGNLIIAARPFRAMSSASLNSLVPSSEAESSIVLPQSEDTGKTVTNASTSRSQMSRPIGEQNGVVAAVSSSTISAPASPSSMPGPQSGVAGSIIVIQNNLPEVTLANLETESGMSNSDEETDGSVDLLNNNIAQPSALGMNRPKSISYSDPNAILTFVQSESILTPITVSTKSPEILSSIPERSLPANVSSGGKSNVSRPEYIDRRDTPAVPAIPTVVKGKVIKGEESEVQRMTTDETVLSLGPVSSKLETGSGKNPLANDALQLQELPLPISSSSTPTLNNIKPATEQVKTEIAVHPLSDANGNLPSAELSSPRKVELPTPLEGFENASAVGVKAQAAMPDIATDDTKTILSPALGASTKQSDASSSVGFRQPQVRTAELNVKVRQNEISGSPEADAKPSPAVISLSPKPAAQLTELDSKSMLPQNESSDPLDAGAKGLPKVSFSLPKPTEELPDGTSRVELNQKESAVNGITVQDAALAIPALMSSGLPLTTDRGNIVPDRLGRTNHPEAPTSKVQSAANKIVAETDVHPDNVQKGMDHTSTPKVNQGENILPSESDGSVNSAPKISLPTTKTASTLKPGVLSSMAEGSMSSKPSAVSDRNSTQSEYAGRRDVNTGSKGRIEKGEETDVQGSVKNESVTVREAKKTESEAGSGKNPDAKEGFQSPGKIVETTSATTDADQFQNPGDDMPTKTAAGLSASPNAYTKNVPSAATQADLLAKMANQLSGIHNSQFPGLRQESNISGTGASSPAQPGLTPGNLEQTVLDQVSKNLVLNLSKNSSEVRIAMKPESLGEVVMKVKMDDGKVSAQITVNNVNVKAVLDANVTHLRDALLSKGIEVQHIDIVADGQAAFGSSSGQNNPKQKSQHRDAAGVDALGQYESLRTMGYNTIELIM